MQCVKGSESLQSVVIEVETYPTARPKFTKQSWESGERGGEGAESG
jgi:hypothetical protein